MAKQPSSFIIISGDSAFSLVTKLPQVFQVDETKDFIIRFKPEDEIHYVDVLSLYFQNNSSRKASQVKVSGGGMVVNTDKIVYSSRDVHVYPNPAKNYIYLECLADEVTGLEVSIYSSSGNLIRQLSLQEKLTKVVLKPGLYFVKINEREVKKILIF